MDEAQKPGLARRWMIGLAILALGCGAISAPGTLYAAIASQARARDVLLPLLLFAPPTILASTGGPMGPMPTPSAAAARRQRAQFPGRAPQMTAACIPEAARVRCSE